jgi:hypothetical protein
MNDPLVNSMMPDSYEKICANTGMSPAEVESAFEEMYSDGWPDETEAEDENMSRNDWEENQMLEHGEPRAWELD